MVELHGYSSRDWSVLSQAGGLWEEEGVCHCQPVVSGLGSAFTRLGDGNPTPSSDSDRWDFQSSGPSCQIAREIDFPSIFLKAATDFLPVSVSAGVLFSLFGRELAET